MQVRTPFFRAAFLNLTEAKSDQEGKPATFNVTALFPNPGYAFNFEDPLIVPADLSEMKKVAGECAARQWGDKIPADLKSPFLDGNLKSWAGFPGTTYLRLSTQNKPGVVGRDGKQIMDDEKIESLIYPGCWCRATINPYSYVPRPNKPNKGVSFGLQSIQFYRNDETFLTAGNPEEDFAALPDNEGIADMPDSPPTGDAAPPAPAGGGIF